MFNYFEQQEFINDDPSDSGIPQVAISENGDYVASANGIYFYNGTSWELQYGTATGPGPNGIDLSCDGVYRFTSSTFGGTLRVHKRTGTTWDLFQDITKPPNSSLADKSICSSGDGSYFAISGTVAGLGLNDPYTLVYYKSGSTYVLQQTLSVSETTSYGYEHRTSISRNGDVLAFAYTIDNVVKIKIYSRSGSVWSLTTSFTITSSTSYKLAGFSMSQDGNVIVAAVGVGNDCKVVTYSKLGGSWAKITETSIQSITSLDINEVGDILVVGVATADRCRVYKQFNNNFTWKFIDYFISGTESFGTDVRMSMDGNFIISTDYPVYPEVKKSFIFKQLGY